MNIKRFRVTNYRNILDSGWINLDEITAFVGQNEAGKSNLFEALQAVNPFEPAAGYDPDEDWPVDDWAGRSEADGKLVCQAEFELDASEIAELYAFAQPRPMAQPPVAAETCAADPEADVLELPASRALPETLLIGAYRHYGHPSGFYVHGGLDEGLDEAAAADWIQAHMPKFVYIRDYETSGAQVELDELRGRWDRAGRGNRHALSHDDQTVLTLLELARVDLDDLLDKGDSAAGRTLRSFDKRAASAYLTAQFRSLWSQKEVSFCIEIDGTTLNIFAEDAEVGMPVRLERRSSGFRWYVSFAWKFTHASAGAYENCVLLLEEPGIHLHASGQRDLLRVFERLAGGNAILYTTHLASMIDPACPERVRIVETNDHHLSVTEGLVSAQPAAMAVIESCLGLSPDLGAMLGHRQVLIIAGGSVALLLDKLSRLLKGSGGEGLADRIYLWPAPVAADTPIYAAFAIDRGWPAAVLLDGGEAAAERKIQRISTGTEHFRLLTFGEAAALKVPAAGIEDLFPETVYRDCVNRAFGIALGPEDLVRGTSDPVSLRLARTLEDRYDHLAPDRQRVMGELLACADGWTRTRDLPGDTAKTAAKLFAAINAAFR